MLYEIRHILQDDPELAKRWFCDSANDLDLFVWFRGRNIVEFRLAYDKKNQEKVLIWRCDGGFRHYSVDTGEQSPLKNMAPMLIPDGAIDQPAVLVKFQEKALELDRAIADFVAEKLSRMLASE